MSSGDQSRPQPRLIWLYTAIKTPSIGHRQGSQFGLIRDGENSDFSLTKTRRHEDTMADITTALGSGYADKSNALEDTDGLVQFEVVSGSGPSTIGKIDG